jgi:hypothetical protein
MYQKSEEIYDFNESFNFNRLTLLKPVTAISGLQTFMRFKMNNSLGGTTPLLVQTPKCPTKKGIITTNKKSSMELLLSLSEYKDTEFIEWINALEKYSRQIIYANIKEWFSGDIINDMDDLESYFRDILKSVKGGVSMTVNIPNDLIIYDESQNRVDTSKVIAEQTNLVCILEFEGIKCNANNFEFVINVRQMMTIEPFFSKCVIKLPSQLATSATSATSATPHNDNLGNALTQNESNVVMGMAMSGNDVAAPQLPFKENENDLLPVLQESEIKMDDESATLKDRHEIYMKLYKDAKEKAKNARHLAIMAYLEKNKIKNTYMLDDIESDDDDDLYD